MAKRVCVDGEDRISELPVHIIHHILCRTDLDVEEAAISCMLSKRWYYCWTSRPNLIFNQFQGYKYRPLENYVKLVDQSLRSHVEKNLHLEQFILTYNGQEVDPHVDTWIELAVKLNVTELGIHRFGLTSYNLPDVIYDAKKLTTLQLSRYTEPTEQGNLHPCQIAILDGYNTLQTLKLTGATITDQQFRDVSYKFPNISELDLARCYKLKNIEIQSEKLKKFTLLEELNSLEKITIQAPNLLKFDFHGSKMPFTYMDTSSLESARLNFFLPGTNFGSVDSSWYTSLQHFVKKFNYSKDFILIIFCHQAMSTLKGCIQKQNCGKECPSDTVWHRNLKEVISCSGTSEEGMAASMWNLWLKSTSLFDQVNNFVLEWKDEA
uniref:F-box family protein n=2 Tax=Solanum tuberosum TaxID=4113 RepID=M1A7X0_SOLTU